MTQFHVYALVNKSWQPVEQFTYSDDADDFAHDHLYDRDVQRVAVREHADTAVAIRRTLRDLGRR